MDRVEQRDRLLGLIGLQRPDEMQLKPGMPRDELRPFGFRFLDAVLTEDALAGSYDRLDGVRGDGLRYRHQRDRSRVAPGLATGARDLLAHRRQSCRFRYAFHSVNSCGWWCSGTLKF
jgi:hypothetical protein